MASTLCRVFATYTTRAAEDRPLALCLQLRQTECVRRPGVTSLRSCMFNSRESISMSLDVISRDRHRPRCFAERLTSLPTVGVNCANEDITNTTASGGNRSAPRLQCNTNVHPNRPAQYTQVRTRGSCDPSRTLQGKWFTRLHT